jgi:hypothetical protein
MAAMNTPDGLRPSPLSIPPADLADLADRLAQARWQAGEGAP